MKKGLTGVSLFTVCGLYILLSAFIIAISFLMGQSVLFGIMVSIIFLCLQFLISPFLTDLSMKWFYKATFDAKMPDYLTNFIQEVCQKENMKLPRIGYIDDGSPNAFTYGHTKNDARIVITRGIFDLLSEEEVKAVVGHELGHAVHYDMLVMTTAQVVPLVLYGIYEVCTRRNHSSSSNKSDSAIYLIGIAAYILYIISNFIVLWLSRTREYYADSYSIEITKNPFALSNALVKIGYGLTTTKQDKKNLVSKSNALGIFDAKTSKSLVVSSFDDGRISIENIQSAMKWEKWNIWAKLFEINSTHPLISKRLLAISERSAEFNQPPYITFNLQQPESYLDDFIIELVISMLPSIIAFFGIFALIVMLITNTLKNAMLTVSIIWFLITITSFIKFVRKRPNRNYESKTVKELLGEVKVSNITAIPCELEGEVIGRGNPGYIFNEDMVIKDSTGILFLDYNQPLWIINKIFALFQNGQMAGKRIKIKGWYRRNPVPYVEIKSYTVDGIESKIFTYPFCIAGYIVSIILCIVFCISIYL